MADSALWAAVPDFPDYEVSTEGQVRRKKDGYRAKAGDLLRQTPNGDKLNYLRVKLFREGVGYKRFVHLLVLQTFKPGGSGQGRHLDGNNGHNSLLNLEWGTAKQNAEDRDAHGTTATGKRNGNCSIPEAVVVAIRQEFVSGSHTHGSHALAKKYGISQIHTLQIAKGEKRTHGG